MQLIVTEVDEYDCKPFGLRAEFPLLERVYYVFENELMGLDEQD